MVVGGQRHDLAALPTGNSPITHWVGPRAGRSGLSEFAPTGVPTPDFLAHSELLHRQRCPGSLFFLL
jgi:hypothetical protein